LVALELYQPVLLAVTFLGLVFRDIVRRAVAEAVSLVYPGEPVEVVVAGRRVRAPWGYLAGLKHQAAILGTISLRLVVLVVAVELDLPRLEASPGTASGVAEVVEVALVDLPLRLNASAVDQCTAGVVEVAAEVSSTTGQLSPGVEGLARLATGIAQQAATRPAVTGLVLESPRTAPLELRA
jgi:hypothetical protein